MTQEYIDECKAEMGRHIEGFRRDLAKVRTGRASVTLFDSIRVDYYGTPTPLQQMATLSVPEPRLIVITPWDKSRIKAIERAIMESDLGVNPNNDGKVIRIALPELTGERRKDLVRQVHKLGEECKVHIRKVRRDFNDLFKSMEKDGEISQDDADRALLKVQEETDKHCARVDEVVAHKEKEIIEV
ncbi:ribosome recycling factor [Myxococcota bacterium]|nr:ribosome recycling factor [Myxococcota bacterium]